MRREPTLFSSGGIKIKKEAIKLSCEEVTTAKVGKKAPEFETNAFVEGGFKKVKLSDYQGKWVVL